MAKRRVIRVTPSQVKTAQDQVERDRIAGRESDPAIVKIANAVQVSVTHDNDGRHVKREGTRGPQQAVRVQQQGGIAQGL